VIVEKLSDNKKLIDVINKLHSEPYPVFLSEDSAVKKYWQRWTGMYFGQSNKYIIQGALNPVNIDLENNLGEYIEPNVWVLYKC